MTAFTLKGLLTRKLRTALTAIAIVLGVATVSGTFVLTDSIDKAFDSIFSDVYRNTDATITPKSAFDTGDNGSTEAPFDQSLLAQVRALPDVSRRDRRRLERERAARQGRQDDRLRRRAEPRLLGRPDEAAVQQPDARTGQAWPGPNEVVVDKSTADKKDLKLPARRSACRSKARSSSFGSPASSSSGR